MHDHSIDSLPNSGDGECSPAVAVRAIGVPVACGVVLAVVLIGLSLAGARSGRWAPSGTTASGEVPRELRGFVVNAESGYALFMSTCSSCHGSGGEGMPMQGANLRRSHFVATRSDEQLLTFLIVGRAPGDRHSVLGRAMPPRGGNSDLGDGDLADIVAFLRRLQAEASASASAAGMPVSSVAAAVSRR
jgi:cytochrome c5